MDERGVDHRARARSRAWTGSRPGRPSSRRCASRAGSSPRSARTCTRSGTARGATPSVEPRLSLQWFVKVEPLAKAAGDAVRDGRVTIHPATMAARYFDWVDNMHDWCISPAAVVGAPDPGLVRPGRRGPLRRPGRRASRRGRAAGARTPTCSTPGSPPRCGRSPRSAGPSETADLRRFYPTDVLVTGYDILFFWVARMMMFGLYAMDGVPAVPHGRAARAGPRPVRQEDVQVARATSSTRWTGSTQYGADALRFTLARGANPGTDVPISEEWVPGCRNFCNKLWNATRFALLNGATVAGRPAGGRGAVGRGPVDPVPARRGDRRGRRAATRTTSSARSCEALYHFAWDEVCDWYLELAKLPLAAGGARRPRSPGGCSATCSTSCCGCCTR